VTGKPVVLRELAQRDIGDAIAYDLDEGLAQAALGFIEDLEHVLTQIGLHPAVGAPRYAHELNLPGLRSWPSSGHPHLVFYVDRPAHVDVWRVVHGQRDLPAWMHEPDSI